MAQRHAVHVERTAEKVFMLSDRVLLSSVEARVEGPNVRTLIKLTGGVRVDVRNGGCREM